MPANKRRRIVIELRRVAKSSGGILLPRAVVDRARIASSPLHRLFEWEDTLAAEKYRIWQAESLIKRTFRVIQLRGKRTAVRVWVSLKPDRYHGGGYREMAVVLSNRDFRTQMLKDAVEEMETFRSKYAGLRELTAVFSTMQRVCEKLKGDE